MPSIEILQVESSGDHDLLLECLENENVEYLVPKSEVAEIILALGGGVGVAAIIRSLGPAIKAYFEGKERVIKAQKRVLIFKYKGKKVEITAENAGHAERDLLREFTPHAK
jgi:hypothetical protein